MDAQKAFENFVSKTMLASSAERLITLSTNKKGQKKILEGLYHQFEGDIRDDAVRSLNYESLWDCPCYVFYHPVGFGVEFASVREAYDRLSSDDGCEVTGIYRPEARWDDEMLIEGE